MVPKGCQVCNGPLQEIRCGLIWRDRQDRVSGYCQGNTGRRPPQELDLSRCRGNWSGEFQHLHIHDLPDHAVMHRLQTISNVFVIDHRRGLLPGVPVGAEELSQPLHRGEGRGGPGRGVPHRAPEQRPGRGRRRHVVQAREYDLRSLGLLGRG